MTTVATRAKDAADKASIADPDQAAQLASDTEGWDEVVTDSGEKIDWKLNQPVEGAFILQREVTTEDGELLPMLVFEVKDKGRMFTWAGPKLKEAFEHIAPRSYVRVTWTGDKEVGRPSPMKMFQVLVRPTPATDAELKVKGAGKAGTAEAPF